MDRRNFLRTSALASVGGMTLRAWSNPTLAPMLSSAPNGDRILVVVQLFGGNDGLSTVVPLDQYGVLSQKRNNILIPEGQILGLQGTGGLTGLHPSLTGLQALWNDGKLGIVQSVGYPQPNFSHFRSTDIWETGSSADQILQSGWLGRYLQEEHPGYPTGYPSAQMPDPISIRVGGALGAGLQNQGISMGISLNNTDDVLNLTSSVFLDPVPGGCSGDKLDFIRSVQRQTDQYGDVIQAAASYGCTHSNLYPTGSAPGAALASSLKIVASLICGGLGTRIYWVSDTGFDTHAQQAVSGSPAQGKQADLLKGISDSIRAFQDDIQQMGQSERVLGMTFSEFGRRIMSNNSLGTDHGAAGPMFFFGDKVVPGILGSNPEISPSTDSQTNVPMQYDFRSVYASVLEHWFCLDPADVQDVLLGDFPSLPIIDPQGCLEQSVEDIRRVAGYDLLKVSPNPFADRTVLTYTCIVPGRVQLQVFNALGELVARPLDKKLHAGTYTIGLDLTAMPDGVYYCRLQNEQHQQVRSMVKTR